MRGKHWVAALIVTLAVAAPAAAQGKGGGADKKKEGTAMVERGKGTQARADKPQPQRAEKTQPGRADKPQQARADKAEAPRGAKPEAARGAKPEAPGARAADRPDHPAADRGRGGGMGRFVRDFTERDVGPKLARLVSSGRAADRVAAGAIARAHARGRGDDFVITPANGRVRVANRNGDVLVDIDEERARNLGRWDVLPLDGEVKSGAPSFCRSGAGHPNWGRQWCINKGFGLGTEGDRRWARSTGVDDIIFRRRTDTDRLTGNVLLDVLGDVVFNRLALHAITLGLTEPVTGYWVNEPEGVRVLRLNSGNDTVAEIVDLDRNDRGDLLVVALRPW